MHSMRCPFLKVVVCAAPLNDVAPCVVGGVDVDIAAVISATNTGSSEVTPCFWPFPWMQDGDNDVSVERRSRTWPRCWFRMWHTVRLKSLNAGVVATPN